MMTNARMRRFTGICALATIVLSLGIFPLYTVGPLGSLYVGAAVAGRSTVCHPATGIVLIWKR
jgi:hypothetical protein